MPENVVYQYTVYPRMAILRLEMMINHGIRGNLFSGKPIFFDILILQMYGSQWWMFFVQKNYPCIYIYMPFDRGCHCCLMVLTQTESLCKSVIFDLRWVSAHALSHNGFRGVCLGLLVFENKATCFRRHVNAIRNLVLIQFSQVYLP